MAANYNKVLLMGNLTRDIELRHVSSNMAVANIGLAVNRRFRTSDGETKEETTFVDCEAWGRTAEVMSQYLHKGRPVFIEGRLKLDQWEDQQGGKRSRLKIVVESFQFIDSRGEGGGSPGGSPGGSRGGGSGGGYGGGGSRGSSARDEGYDPQPPMEGDDIPF